MSEYSSSTIICASSNLANDIRLTHKKQSQERIYKHQKVISLNQWLEEQYQTWCFNHPDSHYHRILNGIEEKFFWEKSIGKFIEKQVSDDFFGIDIEKDIAEFCIRANHAFTEFMVTDAEITKQKHYREIKLFNQIRDDFNAELKKQRLISKDALIKEVIKIQKAEQPIKNERLIFIGFEFDKPIYKELIQLLGQCNHIERCIQNEDSANINYHQFNNVEDEFNHISQWVKKLIDGGAKKILIITPALAEFQSTLENKILRLAQTEIFHDPRLESITTSTLRRPLTNEPSIRFITQLLRMPLKNIIATNEWFEILTFTNWINQENFHQRQKIGEIIKESKRKGFSIEGLMMFIKNHDDLEYQSTIQPLSLIDHFKTNIHKKQSPYLFNKLVLDLIDEIKWMKIYKLLPFEINILDSFYNVLNQISKFPIDEKISYQRYIEVLDYYLEKVMTSEDKPDAKITLSGFMEEQYLNYDAVWVANFNDTFWPEKKAFNPFLPTTIIEDHCIYDESYFRQLTQYRINQAKTITSNFNLSCSHYYDDVPMMPSLNMMNFDKAIELINQEPYELMNYQDFLDDSESIAMTGDLIHIKSGIKTLENHARCPAWSFYANRLGAEPPMTDLFDEVSQLDLGRLIHKTLELFWKKNTELGNLKKLGVSKLKEDLEKIIDPLLAQLVNERPLLSSNQINSCKNYLMKRSLKWLEYEKNRESFEVILQEKNYEVTIKNIAFKIRIDRIDQLEDDTKIIIDYKTGAIPGRSELFNDRLTFLQLPIYGGYTQEQNIKGVMFAHLNIHKNSFYGVTDDAVKISPDFKGVINTPSITNWKDLIKQWRHLLETISLSYQRGDCQVTFYREHDLNFCPVLPIMRLPEKNTSMNQSINTEELIREKATGPGSFILEAPAGSGKTSILTKRFLSLLLQVKKPTEIIALTFTNKAAQEMKNRIRSALKDSQNDGILNKIIHKIKGHAEKLNWDQNFEDQLRIMTIDKLALQVINQAPILDNAGLNYQTDENPDEIYMQAINESLNQSNVASAILDYVENDQRKLSAQLINILKKRDQWLTDLTFYVDKDLEEIKSEYIKYANQEQEQICSQIKDELGKDIIHDIQLIMQSIRPEIKKIDFQFWLAFSNLVLTKEGSFRKQFDKRHGIPNDEAGKQLKIKINDLLLKLNNKNSILYQLNQVNYCNNFINFLPLLPDLILLLIDINQRLMTLFTKLRTFDFSQIILNASRVLEQSNLALILDEKITHILVDEFQDTNYAQLKFIELLTQNFAGDPEKTFFAVGDPMQSIYRFRKAEVEIFKKIQLQQRLGDLHVSPLQLKTNFRSNQKIIEWLNTNISHLFPATDNIELGSITFNASIVGRNEDMGTGIKPHTLIIDSDNNDAIYQTEAMYVAKLLQTVKQKNPAYKIAVLTRSRSHLNELITTIKRDFKDLPIQAIEINSIKNNQTFEDIYMLTKALFNFDDKIAWMALLRSPIIGLKNRELALLFENNHHLNTWSILNDNDLLKTLNEQSAKRLHKLIIIINNNIDLRGRVSQRYFIESIWRQLNGDKAMINFEDIHVVDNFLNLVDQSSHNLLSIDFTRLEKLIDETYISDIDSHPNPIQFLTIQKSKGLEYDAVIIPNMNKTTVNEPHSLFLMDKKLISMINMTDEPNLYDYHRYKEKERLRNEYSRLLYVAITRAKHECHLITSISKDKIDSPSPCNEGSFASLLWPSINKDLVEIKPNLQQNPYNEFIPKLRRLKDHFFEGNLKRNNEIYDGRHEAYINQGFSNLEIEIGTILHKILELIVKKQLFIDNLLENSLNYFEDYFTHYRFSKDDTSYAIEQIKIAIHKLKTTKDGQWITNQFEDDLSEMKYSIDDLGQSISLIPDRTFIENNVRWIVDYKFTKNSDLEKVALSYRSQLEGYKKIYEHDRNINLAIYFINHGRLITLN